VYDDEEGDPKSELERGTMLTDIPEVWRCPVCEAKKSALILMDKREAAEMIQSQSKGKSEPVPLEYDMTLPEVRSYARTKLKGICTVNKICDGNPNRFCMGQKYGEPIGLGGVGKGLSFTANVDALDAISLKTRLISEHDEPEMNTTIFGREISIPIMASSMSGVSASMGGAISEENFAHAVLAGSLEAGTIGWVGNTCDEGKELTGVESIRNLDAGIPIFKPQGNDKLKLMLKLAEEVGATAVGIDLDGVGSTNWERMNKPVYRKSIDEIKELVEATKLPFIVKGIMSVEDALDSVDAGVAGIDVSNHGGRALDSTRGVAEVLPEIARKIKGKVTLTAGGGIRTGFDVLKMIALGADAVLIGRDIIRAALGGGEHGVKLHYEYLSSDLRRGMMLTSCNKISDITGNLIE
jgi:isopentenyl diphosphate isomerase/L-lactate dehydrogenase-like FMN-dependent dehydrogenase/rubredoxin